MAFGAVTWENTMPRSTFGPTMPKLHPFLMSFRWSRQFANQWVLPGSSELSSTATGFNRVLDGPVHARLPVSRSRERRRQSVEVVLAGADVEEHALERDGEPLA